MKSNVQTVSEFVYVPPPAAVSASRILLKPNWGYPKPHPITVSLTVLVRVVEGIRAVNSGAELLLVEGVCDKMPADQIAEKLGMASLRELGVRFFDADTLPLKEYPNQAKTPYRFGSLFAPALLEEVDCCISIGCLKRTILKERVLMSACVKNLFGLLPREKYRARSPHSRGQLHRPDVHSIIADVYHTLGVLFDGGVVDATQKFISKDWEPDVGKAVDFGKIFFGDDLLEVDRAACEAAGEGIPDYLERIETAR